MLKFSIAATIIATLAGTGYLVERSQAASDPSPASHSANAAQTRSTAPVAHRAIAAPMLTGESAVATANNQSGDGGRSAAGALVSYDCAAMARHIVTIALDNMPSPTPEMVASLTAEVGPRFEKRCTEHHWPQAYIDCVATTTDVWDTKCAHQAPVRNLAATYTGDASCEAVAKHISSVLVQPTRSDVPAGLQHELEDRIAALPEDAETACSNAAWPEDRRRCLMAATTTEAVGACF